MTSVAVHIMVSHYLSKTYPLAQTLRCKLLLNICSIEKNHIKIFVRSFVVACHAHGCLSITMASQFPKEARQQQLLCQLDLENILKEEVSLDPLLQFVYNPCSTRRM